MKSVEYSGLNLTGVAWQTASVRLMLIIWKHEREAFQQFQFIHFLFAL